jgi:hypothetical protein
MVSDDEFRRLQVRVDKLAVAVSRIEAQLAALAPDPAVAMERVAVIDLLQSMGAAQLETVTTGRQLQQLLQEVCDVQRQQGEELGDLRNALIEGLSQVADAISPPD